MAKPRSQQLDFENGGYCHLRSRCVRQAYLCGIDYSSGKDYSHRQEWIEELVLFLANVFAVEVFAYAVMDTHYHVVAAFRPRLADGWTPEEIARRWLKLYPKKNEEETVTFVEELVGDPERTESLRRLLSTSPRFMGIINERVARRANAEDQVTGRFWDGRYRSKRLDAPESIPACMAYVDLNPVSAKMVSDPEQSGQVTSLARRLQEVATLQEQQRANITAQARREDSIEEQELSREASSKNDEAAKYPAALEACLKPLVLDEGPLVARTLESGTSLPITLSAYRARVAEVAKRGAGRARVETRPTRGSPAIDDWLERWLKLMKGCGFRSPNRTPCPPWLVPESA